MSRSTSVAIIGGGVMGASVAWHLAKKGVRDVVILDGAPGPAHGSTGRATGGFRAQFSTDINVRLSLYAREQLRSLREETGRDTAIAEVGYLWIASSDSELSALCSALDVQRKAGLNDAVEVMQILMGAYMSAEKERTLSFPPRGVETFVPAVAQGKWKAE